MDNSRTNIPIPYITLNCAVGEPQLRELLPLAGRRHLHPLHGLLHDTGQPIFLFRGQTYYERQTINVLYVS